MRKFILIIFSCILLFVGCSNEHTHTYGEWVRDAYGHYRKLICDKCVEPTVFDPHKDMNGDNYCDVCEYEMGSEHLFKWHYNEDGHIKIPLCDCCDYSDEMYLHKDEDKNNVCDECYYLLIDIDISWLYSETHHWYTIGKVGGMYNYAEHIDDNNDYKCDICSYEVDKEQYPCGFNHTFGEGVYESPLELVPGNVGSVVYACAVCNHTEKQTL